MIKYLGSKRRLVPVLAGLFSASGATTALDLFAGTTRVSQAFKRLGAVVTSVDSARYAEAFGRCWIATAAEDVDARELHDALRYLAALDGVDGYVTETFCVRARYFQPHNGRRIDAMRDAIERDYRDSKLYWILLTSLILAADRVDSTTGLQMAYLKAWAARSFKDLELRDPGLLPGAGHAIRGDAHALVGSLGSFDLAYLDPPYNQHRYYTNYHVFETLVAWDRPAHYGVACKRVDSRSPDTKSVYNGKRTMPTALAETIAAVDAEVIVVSYNDEAWLDLQAMRAMCAGHGHVVALAFDSKRYVGAQIGIYDPSGAKVGAVSHLRNQEYLMVAGPRRLVERMVAPFAEQVVGTVSRDDRVPAT